VQFPVNDEVTGKVLTVLPRQENDPVPAPGTRGVSLAAPPVL